MALAKVRYKGLADVRIIEANDHGMKARGIQTDKDMVWSRDNMWTLMLRDMSPEMEKMFREDGAFSISNVDEDSLTEGEEIVKATRSDDIGNTVIDKTTGQVSKKK